MYIQTMSLSNLIRSVRIPLSAAARVPSLISPLAGAVSHHSTLPHSRYRLFSSDSSENSRLRIYTKTGDKGKSSNFAGQRLPKDDAVFEALGTNDELSSMIGLASEFCVEANHDQDLINMLHQIQCILQDIGSHIATPRDRATEKKLARTTFSAYHVETLESWIDKLDDHLPELKNFILPSGGKSSAVLHLARTICRRTERRVTPLYVSGQVDQEVASYLNRLSDFLFTLARYVAMKEGKKETIYQRTE